MSKPTHNIIIKRVKKVSGDGHHGGAWKVAYADFVTAMMAFFLLMWLLNATTEDQRKGIADYFNPTIPISQISGGGKDALDGSAIVTEEKMRQDGAGGGHPEQKTQVQQTKAQEDNTAESEEDQGRLRAVQEDLLTRAMKEGAGTLASHIQTRMTPDGLVIELVEIANSPLYEVGSSRPSPTMIKLLEIVGEAVSHVANKVAIDGHTDSRPYASAEGYTNWELSSDRANMARRLMVAAGLPESQIAEVSGKADTEPLTADPLAPQNRRISITLLKQ